MYLHLLPKQQFGLLTRLLQHRQLRLIGALATVTCSQPIHCNVHQYKSTVFPSRAIRTYSTAVTTEISGSKLSNETASVEGQLGVKNLEDLDPQEPSFSLKFLLYEETNNTLKQLNHCKDHKELLAAIEKYGDSLKSQHCVQTIILLWSFCHDGDTIVKNEILTHPMLERLLLKLRPHVSAMDINELACSYLYLRKMGVPNTHIVLQELLMRALDLVALTSRPLPLPALSRLIVGINTGTDLYVPMVCQNFMPHLMQHISTCATDDDARLLAICILNLQRLVCVDTLDALKERLRQMLDAGTLNSHSLKPIVKLLHMLNMPRWSHRNSKLLRELLLTIGPTLNELNDVELKTACRVFQHHLEPARLAEPLMKATKQQLHKNATPDALSCYLPFVEPRNRGTLISAFKQLITSSESWKLPNASSNFFAVLRGLKIADMRLCDAYWTGVMHELDSYSETGYLGFLRHCHRYMNFNNNLGGTYRNHELERRLSSLAMHAIDAEIAGRIPAKFSRLAAFVLAYGHTPYSWKKFPNTILSKIISMADQFSIIDCYFISRGLQIAAEMRFRHHTPPVLNMQLASIDSILKTCADRHLNSNEAITTIDLNAIVRTLANRKTLKNAIIYQEALMKYKELDYGDLNSRTVRDMAFNLTSSSYLVPQALEAMFNYIEQNHEHVMGDTVEKVISCAYHLGYSPQSLAVLDHAATILMRDFNFMSGLSLVQACLALCYYKTMPDDLINRVFCVHFIKRVEEEIQACYSKGTYPERVQQLIMQLNRTVCLDFPEANVPWFQQNYLEAHLSRKPAKATEFSREIQQLLESVLKDQTYFRCNHITPYGYQIDFVIHFDKNKKPIPEAVETTMLDRITKVAILLLKLDSFCDNDLTTLRGPDSLKIKHLEMMGYKVLHINEHDWNSKYMNAPGAKANYLKCLLQISN